MNKLICLLLLALVMGCVTTQRISRLQVGASREEVIRLLGQPESISASQNAEVLHYELRETINDWYTSPYYVRIINGKVDAFGRLGTYGTQ